MFAGCLNPVLEPFGPPLQTSPTYGELTVVGSGFDVTGVITYVLLDGGQFIQASIQGDHFTATFPNAAEIGRPVPILTLFLDLDENQCCSDQDRIGTFSDGRIVVSPSTTVIIDANGFQLSAPPCSGPPLNNCSR